MAIAILNEEARDNKLDINIVQIVEELIHNNEIFTVYEKEKALSDSVKNM